MIIQSTKKGQQDILAAMWFISMQPTAEGSIGMRSIIHAATGWWVNMVTAVNKRDDAREVKLTINPPRIRGKLVTALMDLGCEIVSEGSTMVKDTDYVTIIIPPANDEFMENRNRQRKFP